ncbi:subunit of FACT complex, partial [Hamiltosporidium tvaerminnensis]
FLTNQKNLISNIKERTENEKFKEIVTFETLQTVLPRGKCDYIFYDNHFKIVGSTYEHKVFYSSVKGIFYLEKYDFDQNDNKEYFLALNVDPSIRQGQTRYSFIVINFYEVEEEEFTLNLTEEDKIKHKDLQAEYTGPVGSSFLKIMKILTNSKVFTTKDFVTKEGNRSLKCASKAYEGYLYPLSKSLLFLPKAIYMPHGDISLVEFSRVNLSVLTAKTFDMKIFTSEGQFTFNSIQKEDFGPIERYFSEHNINVRSEVIDDQDEYSEEEDEEDTTDIMNTSDGEED